MDSPASAFRAIPATVESLRKVLASRPVLWVGTGASIAAGYPSRAELERAIREDADANIPPDLMPEVADAYIAANNKGTLTRLLDQLLRQEVHAPTTFHHAVAQLARDRVFAAIITTNFDRLLERALDQAGVVYVVQTLHEQEEETNERRHEEAKDIEQPAAEAAPLHGRLATCGGPRCRRVGPVARRPQAQRSSEHVACVGQVAAVA